MFTNTAGGPLRRTLFRSRVWRPALVRAGLLGAVAETGPGKWHATWTDAAGVEWSAEFITEREAVAHVARKAAGGLRFHDLRHSYATWLVSRGVPVNDLQRAMGHERASTTLDRYTHRSVHRGEHVRSAFADDSLTTRPRRRSRKLKSHPKVAPDLLVRSVGDTGIQPVSRPSQRYWPRPADRPSDLRIHPPLSRATR